MLPTTMEQRLQNKTNQKKDFQELHQNRQKDKRTVLNEFRKHCETRQGPRSQLKKNRERT
jgi:hypothetical protein